MLYAKMKKYMFKNIFLALTSTQPNISIKCMEKMLF